ncbi:MAG: hypothetical protein A2Y00_08875 [Omnitrophica WOR_2 bacterium GWF2_43_52]|nr:MAG: hypothetical protein A2Y00_08875 [Omnitrophica WOR_2 bacterium GWF2_43_52]HAH20467.1 hypothetical protein [Candidatus Omnitrophota bacterium]HBG62836.1 hypothetical protein [Candidatus Omnitrophota bacterium]
MLKLKFFWRLSWYNLFLILFFCLLLTPAFAVLPTTGTVTPSSGTTTPDVARSFSTIYTDTDGWANLRECYFLVSTSSTSLTNASYLYYNQNTNLLYVRNDANTAWLGGYAPGSANLIENSYVRLNCAMTTATGSGSSLTISWNVTFKPAYSGRTYNTYLRAVDDASGSASWASKGTYTVNRSPLVGTITPSTGSGQISIAQTFTATYTDSDGWQNLQQVYLLINSSTGTTNCFYGYYNQNTNLLYLRNDDNTSWLGGYAPGSNNTIENSYVKLNCASTSISGTSSTLTVNWSVTLKAPFTGSRNTYLYARDDVNVTNGWTQKGTWSILNTAPILGTITPSSGSSSPNQTVSFTTTYTDSDTWLNIQYVYLLVNTSTSGVNCFYGYYNQNNNRLYLRNDANTAWSTGYAPGASNVIENSYAKLNCAGTSVSGSGNTMTVNWSVTFKSTFPGTKNTYLYVRDDANSYVSLAQKGTWSIQTDTTPPTGTIKINNDSQYTNSSTVSLTLSATDTGSGMGTGAQMQFSNDGTTWSTAENYTTTKTWTLSSGQGEKRVYVRYKDAAGNWSSAYSDVITLDTTAPTITITSVTSPTNQDVTLSYSVSDNYTAQSQITVTGDNSPYTTEGTHSIALSAKDLAGNTATKSVSFTIDKTAPAIVITSPEDGATVETNSITLQGTIDGQSFSETVTLSQEGENTITKTVTDLAGNTASKSITLYYYLGETIGSAGGVVYSNDGKVKLTIPTGALTENKQIKVLTINTESLEGSEPNNTSLLSVVECKPYGLVFTKPATLSYTLNQAEVPGTPVELGLYDSLQDKITSTGQSTTVPVDGYTVDFSIMHFSTYAALKNLIAQSTPIGANVKIPLPDMLTGTFSHAIPITVVPGRKGMQPAIGLSYRSGSPNSWVGLGFSLNPGYIVRSTRLGPPKYNDTQDTFYLITDAGTTELVHLIDNLYQAKVESAFSKFYKEGDDSWSVVGKDGSVLRFGQNASAKETSNSGTFSWYVTRAVELNGNYISYSYTQDQGKCYLNRIDYTGNEQTGTSPANSVEFTLETRDDIASSYISTAKVATARRLKEIQVKLNNEAVWRYVLEYSYSPDTNRSLLKSVTQYASDGKSLPVQRMSYQRGK